MGTISVCCVLLLQFILCAQAFGSKAIPTKDREHKRSDDADLYTLQALIQQQSVQIQQQSSQIQQQSALIQQQSAQLQTLQSKMTAMENAVTGVESKLQQKVAFTATFSHGGSLNIGQSSPIAFDKVITNIGDGYDVHTGVFTTPVSGTYLFLLHIKADGQQHDYVEFGIEKSGSILIHLGLNGDTDRVAQNSVSVVMHSTIGEKVLVKHVKGPTFLDQWEGTGFSGMLLYAD